MKRSISRDLTASYLGFRRQSKSLKVGLKNEQFSPEFEHVVLHPVANRDCSRERENNTILKDVAPRSRSAPKTDVTHEASAGQTVGYIP
jgi:hypothetical protein